ncbi:MAG: hypothetical protein IPK83_18985 [Planctomycetes bacterium]|nr:hypothetical protein [Planctomycetota bacterium]
MLDEQRERMLNIAILLSADELDRVREGEGDDQADGGDRDLSNASKFSDSALIDTESPQTTGESTSGVSGLTIGERERLRTRESKVSTTCVGQPREPHEWWPVGTSLEGRIGKEVFDASVVPNPRVKSGRSILIDSGPAQGRVCLTPTRAAIEATEEYRRIANLGRGGGVTNGWSFWKPKQ